MAGATWKPFPRSHCGTDTPRADTSNFGIGRRRRGGCRRDTTMPAARTLHWREPGHPTADFRFRKWKCFTWKRTIRFEVPIGGEGRRVSFATGPPSKATVSDRRRRRDPERQQRGVLTAANSRYWPTLRLLAEAVRGANESLAVVDHGLTAKQS